MLSPMLQLFTFDPTLSLLLGVIRCALWSHALGHCDSVQWTATYRDDAAGRGIVAVVRWEVYTTSYGELVLSRGHWTAPEPTGSNPSITAWPHQNRRDRDRPFVVSTRPKSRRSVARIVFDVLVGRDRRPRFRYRRYDPHYGSFQSATVPVWVALLSTVGPSPQIGMFVEFPAR